MTHMLFARPRCRPNLGLPNSVERDFQLQLRRIPSCKGEWQVDDIAHCITNGSNALQASRHRFKKLQTFAI